MKTLGLASSDVDPPSACDMRGRYRYAMCAVRRLVRDHEPVAVDAVVLRRIEARVVHSGEHDVWTGPLTCGTPRASDAALGTLSVRRVRRESMNGPLAPSTVLLRTCTELRCVR